MDWLMWIPWVIGAIVAAAVAFVLFNWIGVKKLKVNQEPVVGDYRIEVDVGRRLECFEGELRYFEDMMRPGYLHQLAETLSSKTDKGSFEELREYLVTKCHHYAMRQGTRKYAFISAEHPIEVSPFFKSEQGSDIKVVHAVGTNLDTKIGGYYFVAFEPVDLSTNELNPKDYSLFGHFAKFTAHLLDKAPLMARMEALEEECRIMESKNQEIADKLGQVVDERESWKFTAELHGAGGEPKEEEGTTDLGTLIKQCIPYAILFGVGYWLSPFIPDLAEFNPAVLGTVLAVGGYLVKRVLDW